MIPFNAASAQDYLLIKYPTAREGLLEYPTAGEGLLCQEVYWKLLENGFCIRKLAGPRR